MPAARTSTSLADPYFSISLYTDISAATAQKQTEFAPVTTVLQDHNITYKYGFPTKLMVTFQSQATTIFTPKEGIKRLLNWSLISSPPPAMDSHR